MERIQLEVTEEDTKTDELLNCVPFLIKMAETSHEVFQRTHGLQSTPLFTPEEKELLLREGRGGQACEAHKKLDYGAATFFALQAEVTSWAESRGREPLEVLEKVKSRQCYRLLERSCSRTLHALRLLLDSQNGLVSAAGMKSYNTLSEKDHAYYREQLIAGATVWYEEML